MPDVVYLVRIERIVFSPKGRREGDGTANFDVQVEVQDGKTYTIGDKDQNYYYRAKPGGYKMSGWEAKVEIPSGKSAKLVFKCHDGSKRRLAKITWRMRPPWRTFEYELLSTRYLHVIWSGKLLKTKSKFSLKKAFLSRKNKTSSNVDTHSTQPALRLEICPVRPVPPDRELPPRPTACQNAPNVYRNTGMRDVSPTEPLNVIANPAVIPILDAPPKKVPKKRDTWNAAAWANQHNCARIEVTYYWPDTYNFQDADKRLIWERTGGAGNVAFIPYKPGGKKSTAGRGLKVMAYGTQAGDVVLSVRMGNTRLASFRALVAEPKRIPCRFNIIRGPHPMDRPASDAADVEAHREAANRLLRQVGVTLVADPTTTIGSAPNGGQVTATNKAGVFHVRTTNVNETRNLADNLAPAVLAYNRRAGVLNFAYIHSFQGGHLGQAQAWPRTKLSGRTTSEGVAHSPSSSWIRPSGVLPDHQAGTVKTQFGTYITHPTHNNLYGMLVASAGGNPSGDDLIEYAGTIAHEVGHMLNLCHRVEEILQTSPRHDTWYAGTLRPGAGGRIPNLVRTPPPIPNQAPPVSHLAHDGVWCDELWHPRFQNVMHWNGTSCLAQDFDILQAKIVQQSPILDLAL